MKKLILFMALSVLFQMAFAGGLLTNSNQSAQFIRMMSRNASLGIDGVYFNPAGLIKLEDGWHFAFSSQTVLQDRMIDTNFPLLNESNYEGGTTVPVFPNAYAVYKKENWAFSFGFGPNAGGGKAEFNNGMPTFEIPITRLGVGLESLNPLFAMNGLPVVEGYDADLHFKGTSIFWGIQLGATYKLNDVFSVYGGVRVLPAKNAYAGQINAISLNTSTGQFLASEYMQMVSPVINGTINTLNAASTGLKTAIDYGMVDPGSAVLDPQINQVLALLGVSNVSNQEAVVIMNQTKNSLELLKSSDVSNKEVDAIQHGLGFTPMVGINISPNDDWNLAVKYEMKTKLELENKTTIDDLGFFPDGGTKENDVPAILGIGIGYTGLDWLEAQFSYTQFFDKDVEWGLNTRDVAVWQSADPSQIRAREIDNNFVELGLGLQFNLSDNFAFSVGGLRSKSGIADSYQSDFSFSNPSYTAGAGIEWKLSENITLDAGFSNTFYEEMEVTFADPDLPDYSETFDKTTVNFAVGLSYCIF